MKEYGTDKTINGYAERYREHFRHLFDKPVSILELGIFKGESLRMWKDMFPHGTVIGLDINPVEILDKSGRIHAYCGLQQDTSLLDKIRTETAKDGFDIIIDDASHLGELTKISFWHLFNNHLKPGGIYVIEDWRTGYWGKFPDGKQYVIHANGSGLANFARTLIDSLLDKLIQNNHGNVIGATLRKVLIVLRARISQRKFRSHDWGMVGFIKELVDELGMDMITSPKRGSKIPQRDCKFLRMEIFPGQVFIFKSHNI